MWSSTHYSDYIGVVLRVPRNVELLLVPGRGVAQPGSAHAWGACGRRFKSGHPDQIKILFSICNAAGRRIDANSGHQFTKRRRASRR